MSYRGARQQMAYLIQSNSDHSIQTAGKGPVPLQADLFVEHKGIQAGYWQVEENYRWDWPVDRSPGAQPPTTSPLPARFRQTFLSHPDRREKAAALFGRIHGEFSQALGQQVPVYTNGRFTRLEFMGSIAWVVCPHEHSIFIETRDENGTWVRSRQTINLDDPLADLLWLDQAMQRWRPEVARVFPDHAPEAFWNLQESIARNFNCPDWTDALSRQIRHHFGRPTELKIAFAEIRKVRPALQCNNQSYPAFWVEESAWFNLARHYRGLCDLYHLMRREGELEQGAGLKGLYCRCRQLGMSRSGWRFLVRWGALAYLALVAPGPNQTTPAATLLAYVDWQARAGLKRPMPRIFGNSLMGSACFATHSDGLHHVKLDPVLAHIVMEHSKALDREQYEYWQMTEEWRDMLGWLQQERPRFDRNQRKAGWPAVRRAWLKWLQAQPPEISWEPVLGKFKVGEWQVRELSDSAQLTFEGARMHHCAAMYTLQCSRGEYLICSVEHTSTGKPEATVGFCRSDRGWDPEQVRGMFNGEPGEAMIPVTLEIARRLGRAWRIS